MTNEERHLIKECRIMVIGTDTFVAYLKSELKSIGFSNIVVGNDTDYQKNSTTINIISKYGGNENSHFVSDIVSVPIIYTFDFVRGAGAIVIMPGDDKEVLAQTDLRLWAAEYMSGYCAFWNMEGCDWLGEAFIIRKSKNPEKPKRKVQNPAKIRRNHNSKRLLKYKSRNIGMIKKSIGSKQIRCSFFAYRSRNIIKHYVRVMGIIVH